MKTVSLGDRMKGYEKVPSQKLYNKMPVVLRLDGKAFHTYTKGFDKPFDNDLHEVRENTLKYLCENIQGALFGYAQSDELSIVLKDWDTFSTASWFDNKIMKLCSVSASMCTAQWNYETCWSPNKDKFRGKIAMFDSRCFNLPKEDVVNYFVWRQQDWERNSVQMIGQSLYSHKQLQGVSCKEIITKIEDEHGIVWGELPAWQKRGEFWIKSVGITNAPMFNNVRGYLEDELNKTFNDKEG